MKPRLAQSILRDDSAYWVGRLLIDLLVIIQGIGVFSLAGYCIAASPPEFPFPMSVFGKDAGWYMVVVGVVEFVIGVIFRELAHALFDLADARLRDLKAFPEK